MALPLEQFVKQLEDSGILAAETLKDFIPPKANPKDAEDLARQLVQKKKLTKFQASEAYQGKATSLRLGNYTILDKIGQGGMGQVFKAEHRRMHRIVAIKMLPAALTKDAAALARFEREVTAAAKLMHSNIVSAFDADEAKGVHFLVMEYVEGRDLSALVKKDGPFPVDKAVNYVLQAARGLEFAHKSGVIHRDIKPANLLLSTEGTVKILDMGLARIDVPGGDADTQAELTGTGMVMGTVDYMAPEQGMSTKNADARADIYSLGCTLHYLLIGKAVYSGETVMAKMVAHVNHPIPNLCQLRDEVPYQVDTIFRKMVAKKIEDRYQTMSEVVADLERCGVGRDVSFSGQQSLGLDNDEGLLTFLKDIPVGTTHKPRAAKAAGQSGSKNKKPLLIGAGVLGVLVLAAVIFMLKTKDGTLIVEVNQPDAMVEVLDGQGKIEISQPGGLKPISISVVPGKHGIRVEKDGFTTITDNFEIESGGKLDIKARLVPKGKPAAGSGQQAAGAKPWETPAFQQWMKTVAALPAEKQVEAVSKKLMELNPGFDGKVRPGIEKRVVTSFEFVTDNVTDISPVRAFDGLKTLVCYGSKANEGQLSDLSPLQGMKLASLQCGATEVSDLSPLQGMPLTNLKVGYSRVSDLSPLIGMPLTTLDCGNTQVSDLAALKGIRLNSFVCNGTGVSDLSPLQGMPLNYLSCGNMQVTELSPLKGMPLTTLICWGTQISDLSPLRDCKSLEFLSVRGTKVTASGVAALQKVLPNCKIEWPNMGQFDGQLTSPTKPITNINNPAFQVWMKTVAALPAEKQVEAVSKKLMELNPGFDGRATAYDRNAPPKIETGVVTELTFFTDNVTDISPVRALAGLKTLACCGSSGRKGKLSDLSPLQGMKLANLDCGLTQVSDLSPLQGMQLTVLFCSSTQVSDLSPLAGMPLTDLSIHDTQVSNISALQGMPLSRLNCYTTEVSDLSPLQGMNLADIRLTPKNITKGLEVIRQMKNLKLIAIGGGGKNEFPPSEFWKKYDAGEFGKPAEKPKLAYLDPAFQQWVKSTQALPAEKQIEAVSKKLMELNPGFDGVMTGLEGNDPPKIEKGMVTQIKFVADNVVDISPVRVLAGLKILRFGSPGRRSKLSDLSPLEGMKLTSLEFWGTEIVDLSPLRRMPLTSLNCSGTRVMDLSPLQGMPLTGLWLNDLPVFDISPLIDCKTLNTLTLLKTKVTAASVAALQKALPKCQITFDDPSKPATNQPWNTRAFQQWVKATQALPAEKQIEAVSKKLMELNPGFDGKLAGYDGKGVPKVQNGVVTELGILDDNVTDISPVRALLGLRSLSCSDSSYTSKSRFSDLSPLTGMGLTTLLCVKSSVSDLSPLTGMPLVALLISYTNVTDLSALRGMSLRTLDCSTTQVSDLAPLEGMPLTLLHCSNTKVSDLSPLTGCKGLKSLVVKRTKATPAQVAALQKALPNCKIEWDDPAKPKTPEPAASGTK